MYLLIKKNYMNFFLSKSTSSRRGAGQRGGADRNAPFTRKRGMGVPALLWVRSHLCTQTEGALPSPAPPFGCRPCAQTGGTRLGLCMHPGSCAPNEGERGRGGTKTGGCPSLSCVSPHLACAQTGGGFAGSLPSACPN